MTNQINIPEPVKQGAAAASEILIPGGSNLIKGDLKQAAVHAALGFALKMALGVPGLLLVSANSFVKASTGRHLYEHLGLAGHTSDDDDTLKETGEAGTRPTEL